DDAGQLVDELVAAGRRIGEALERAELVGLHLLGDSREQRATCAEVVRAAAQRHRRDRVDAGMGEGAHPLGAEDADGGAQDEFTRACHGPRVIAAWYRQVTIAVVLCPHVDDVRDAIRATGWSAT